MNSCSSRVSAEPRLVLRRPCKDTEGHTGKGQVTTEAKTRLVTAISQRRPLMAGSYQN
jgi:hypothetical protein